MTTCFLEPNGKKSTRQDHDPLCAAVYTRGDRLKETTEERDRPETKLYQGTVHHNRTHKKIRGSGTYSVSARVSVMCPCEPTAQHRSPHQRVGHTLGLILYRALLNTQQQTDAVNTLHPSPRTRGDSHLGVRKRVLLNFAHVIQNLCNFTVL